MDKSDLFVAQKQHRIEMIDVEIEMLKQIWQDPVEKNKDGIVGYVADLLRERKGLERSLSQRKADYGSR